MLNQLNQIKVQVSIASIDIFKISFLSSFIERSSCRVESKMQKFFNRIEAEMKSFFFIFLFFFSSRQTSPDKGRKLFFMEFKFCCRGEREKKNENKIEIKLKFQVPLPATFLAPPPPPFFFHLNRSLFED